MGRFRVWVFTTDMGGVLTVAEGRELAAELSAQHKGLDVTVRDGFTVLARFVDGVEVP